MSGRGGAPRFANEPSKVGVLTPSPYNGMKTTASYNINVLLRYLMKKVSDEKHLDEFREFLPNFYKFTSQNFQQMLVRLIYQGTLQVDR